MTTPVQILLNVRANGGDLSIATGDQLRVRLPVDCSSKLKREIREQKAALLLLLGAKFLVVWSRLLNEIVFFVADDETKTLFVVYGAAPGSIYTRDELAALVQRKVTSDELTRIHAAKQQFNATVAP
jgi:hypothetical protein